MKGITAHGRGNNTDGRIRDDAAAGNLRRRTPVLIDVRIVPELGDRDRVGRTDAAAADQLADLLPCVAMAGLDGDLQDDPSEIPRFLSKLDEGYDLVSGGRTRKREI